MVEVVAGAGAEASDAMEMEVRTDATSHINLLSVLFLWTFTGGPASAFNSVTMRAIKMERKY